MFFHSFICTNFNYVKRKSSLEIKFLFSLQGDLNLGGQSRSGWSSNAKYILKIQIIWFHWRRIVRLPSAYDSNLYLTCSNLFRLCIFEFTSS